MVASVSHTFVSPVVDDGVTSEVGPNEWNAVHTILGTFDSTQIAAGGIDTANIAAQAVTSSEIKLLGVTAAQIANNTITSNQLAASAVTSTIISADAVTSLHIATGAVTSAEIGAAAVSSTKILDGSVITAKIATGAVTSTQLATDAVTTVKILDAAVTFAKIQDASTGSVLLGRRAGSGGDFEEITLGTNLAMVGSVLNAAASGATLADADYGDITVTGSGTIWNIDPGVVGSTEIATGGVATGNIAAQAVTSSEIKLLGVTAAQIANDTITSTQLANDAVASNEILAGAVVNAKLATDAVTSTKIIDGGVSNAKLATDAVTSTKIIDGGVSNAKLATDAVTSTKIIDGGVSNAKLATNAVTSTKIIDAGVTYAKIQDVSVGSVLLGRDTSGAGDVQEISLGTGLAMVGSVLTNTVSSSSVAAAGVAGNIQFAGASSAFAADPILNWNSTGGTLFAGVINERSIGGTTPRLQTHNAGGAVGVFRYTTGGTPARVLLGLSRTGTVGSPAAVQDGDWTGEVRMFGHDGTDFVEHAAMRAEVDGTPGTGDMPGRLTFHTTPDASSTAVERMRIKADGTFSFHANAVGAIWSTPASGDCLWGWDNSASTYTNMTVGTILTEGAPAAGDFVLLMGAEGDLRKVDWSGIPALTDGDKGDVVVSTSGTVWTIDAGVVTSSKIATGGVATGNIAAQAVTSSEIKLLGVTAAQIANDTITSTQIAANAVTSSELKDASVIYAKIQDVSVGSVLLGRDTSGAGDVQEIQLGTNLSMVGSTLNAAGAAPSSTITVANEATDTTNFLAFFVDSTGDLGPKTNSNMTFNASTGVVTLASTILTTTDINGGTIDNAVIGGSTAAAATVTTLTVNTNANPDANDGAALGTSALGWSDLFVASGAVLNWDSSQFTITHLSNTLLFQGATGTNLKVVGTTTQEPRTQVGLASDANARINFGLDASDNPQFGFGPGGGTARDTFLNRDAAQTFAQRNGTSAQVFRVYRTFTDSSNYERLALQTAAGVVELAAETAGTGTDDIDVKLTPAGAGNVVLDGLTFTPADEALDVLFGWDDSAGVYKNMTNAVIATEAAPAAGDFILINGAEGDLRKVNWSSLPSGGNVFTKFFVSGQDTVEADSTTDIVTLIGGGAVTITTNSTTDTITFSASTSGSAGQTLFELTYGMP